MRLALVASLACLASGFEVTLSPACSANATCSAVIAGAVAKCPSPLPCTVRLSPGVYITKGKIALPAVSNVSILGYGAVLNASALAPFFGVGGATNITVAGLTLDTMRQPYTYGTVTSVTGGNQIVVKADSPMYTPPQSSEDSWLNTVQATLQYDPVAQRPLADAFDSYDQTTCVWSGNTLSFSLPHAPSSLVNTHVIVRHQVYSMNGFSFTNCTDVTLTDITLLSTPGMGAYFNLVDTITLDNFQVKKAPGRPMSITADGSHFNTCKGHIQVSNSLFEGQGDDGCNVHGKFGSVQSVAGSTVVYAAANATAHSAMVGTLGDTFEFLTEDSMESLGTGRLLAVNTSSRALVFSGVPPTVVVGSIFRTLAWEPSFTAVNTTYKDNRARGMLVKTSNTLLSQNSYIGNSGPAVQIAIDDTFWFESGPVSNWEMRDCVVSDVNYGPARRAGDVFLSAFTPTYPAGVASGQLHHNITVENNTFHNSTVAVAVWATDALMVRGNTVELQAPPQAPLFANTSCVGVNAADNMCTLPGGSRFAC